MQDLVGPALGTLALVAAGGYLLGSIPFGVILTRVVTGQDVRSIGSGNIGATNVLRTGRKDLAIATLILDAGKGAAALLIARELFNSEVAGAIALVAPRDVQDHDDHEERTSRDPSTAARDRPAGEIEDRPGLAQQPEPGEHVAHHGRRGKR